MPADPALPHDPVERAVAVLARTGAEADANLSLVADDPDPRVRIAALTALVRAHRPGGADGCRAALRDTDASVRRRAAEHAAVIDVSLDAITPLLGDDDPTVVEAAAWALGERADSAAVGALSICATDHHDPLAREAAVAALGAIGHPDGLPAILHGCGDKPAIRRRAVLALAPFDGPEVDAAIERALADRDWQVRQAAEDLRVASAPDTDDTP